MGTPLGPKYIPYTYMDPLGRIKLGCHQSWGFLVLCNLDRNSFSYLDPPPALYLVSKDPNNRVLEFRAKGPRTHIIGFRAHIL